MAPRLSGKICCGAWWRMRAFALSFAVVTVAGCDGALDELQSPIPCPDFMKNAVRLILVTADGFHASDARLQRLERSHAGEAWRPVGHGVAATIGRNGLGWGLPFRDYAAAGDPIKQEGDGRAPAGVYTMGVPFGFGPSPSPGYLQLQSGQHYCVDDPASEQYSRIVPRSDVGEGVSGEAMASIDLYRHGIVVDYPTSRQDRAGSCIFVHVWKEPGHPTAGCVALAEDQVAGLQAWTQERGGGSTAIVLLPAAALSRFGSCLPKLNGEG